jgi:hypothetical protein
VTKWYRYEATHYAAPADEFGESRGFGSTSIVLHEYEVARTTPKGVWLRIGFYGDFAALDAHERFVLTSARKRFACPTKREAMDSFIARKKKEIRIYTARIERARGDLRAAESVTL